VNSAPGGEVKPDGRRDCAEAVATGATCPGMRHSCSRRHTTWPLSSLFWHCAGLAGACVVALHVTDISKLFEWLPAVGQAKHARDEQKLFCGGTRSNHATGKDSLQASALLTRHLLRSLCHGSHNVAAAHQDAPVPPLAATLLATALAMPHSLVSNAPLSVLASHPPLLEKACCPVSLAVPCRCLTPDHALLLPGRDY
jgi:hypothetical protein